MGLLRACADAVLLGVGTLRATPGHQWTPEHIYPDRAESFAELRNDLERKRDDAKRKEDQVRHDLDLAHASETELEKHLAQIASDLVSRQADASDAQSDADEAAASVVRITADIAGLKVELAHRKDIFNRRAVMAYMGGQGRPLDDFALAGELLSMPSEARLRRHIRLCASANPWLPDNEGADNESSA